MKTRLVKNIFLMFFASSLLFFDARYVWSGLAEDSFSQARRNMIENDLKGRDITNTAVLKAMDKVKRHLFVDADLQQKAYSDYPLPIGEGQTISQPYIVALMTQCLALKKEDKVLEIGTGSGYQAAVLAEIAGEVYSIELQKNLADRAATLLKSLRYQNIKVKASDGFFGWEEQAPFDAIILTCSVNKIPPALVKQLKDGGRIILPLGSTFQIQSLMVGIKKGKDIEMKNIAPVRFVPMRGEVEK